MAAKKIICDWSETAKIVYAIVRREADGYRMNDADGAFASAPADPYLSLAEDSVIKGRYEVSESRTVWTDGQYTIVAYKQAGGSPAPVSDTIIGTGEMYVKDDAEVVLDVLPSTRATQTSVNAIPVNPTLQTVWTDAKAAFVDVAVSSRLAATSYTAPDNAGIAAIQAKTDTITWSNITDLHDEAMGAWTLDPTAKTLTLKRANGSTLKVFSLTDTSTTVPAFIGRTPQ